jgi:hypothetical protein
LSIRREDSVAVVDDLLQILARSIFSKITALQSLKLTRNQRKRLQDTIAEDIRACGGLLYPEVRRPEVSEAALREAELISVDLRAETWHSQSRFDKGRSVFQWEHVDTISGIQKACARCESEQAVLKVLRTRLRIAWILKREDQELSKLGFRSDRPDPEEAYRAAGIVLVKRETADAE